jgi:hypothetical protein
MDLFNDGALNKNKDQGNYGWVISSCSNCSILVADLANCLL